ncbi:MAG: vitamin B12 dependent-methionine synthase activation domain-containing protein [Bythopirellula sp.]
MSTTMIPDPTNELFELEPRVIDRVDEAIDRCEVLRYLGYPTGVTPNDRIGDLIDHGIEEAEQLAASRVIYVVGSVVELTRRRLCVQTASGITEFNGAIGEFLGASRSIAAFIATAGPTVERRASELLRSGDSLAATILHAVGAERAEAAEAKMIVQLREQAAAFDLVPTLPYSPGYCGMKLTEQRKLFSLFDGEDVGVTLTPECLMRPIKSVSGLIGLGRRDEVMTLGTPCDRCELENCNMRR